MADEVTRSLATVDESTPPFPAAWERQSVFGGDVWAVPLGCSIPTAIVSPATEVSNATTENLESLLRAIAIDGPKPPTRKIDPKSVDRASLVDRFLAIAGSLTARSPDYGLLFDLQKMTPRLTEPEFKRAAEILQSLSQQTSEPDTADSSVVGDSSQAWRWIHAQSKPALAFVSPSQVSVDAAKETGCKAIRIPPQALGWNTGSGLIAALSTNCRQSSRATDLLRWLRQSETRNTLAPLIAGIESSSPGAGSDSSAWQARTIANDQAANANLPSELRLPRAEEYRNALADSLIAILRGDQTVEDALQQASSAWQAITSARGRELQRGDYERSLGLVRN